MARRIRWVDDYGTSETGIGRLHVSKHSIGFGCHLPTVTDVIVVTGGTGFVGRRVVAAFVAQGHRVRVLTRSRQRAQPPADAVEFHEASLLDPSSLLRALDGAGVVVHLAAAMAGDQVRAVNVEGAGALSRAARHAGVRRFVHCSSGGVYGDGTDRAPHTETDAPHPASPYERSKLEGEHAVASALGQTMPWTILRPSGIYGPGRPATTSFLRAVQSRSWFVHGPATVIVHPTYVDDVVEAVLATVEHEGLGGETINIGGAQALTYIELIDLVASTLGRPVHHVRMPAALRHAAALMGMVGILPARFERLTRPVVNRALDTSKASRLLGLHPLPLQEGLERTVAALRAQHLL